MTVSSFRFERKRKEISHFLMMIQLDLGNMQEKAPQTTRQPWWSRPLSSHSLYHSNLATASHQSPYNSHGRNTEQTHITRDINRNQDIALEQWSNLLQETKTISHYLWVLVYWSRKVKRSMVQWYMSVHLLGNDGVWRRNSKREAPKSPVPKTHI